MNADTLRIMAVVFLALAVVLAALSVVLYRVLDIPGVRDELSGRTAEREIAQLRKGRAGSWQKADAESRGRRRHGARSKAGEASGSGSSSTSDIEFRPVTGSSDSTGSSGSSGSGSASTDAGRTLNARSAADASSSSASQDVPAVEIPVSMASAAELADEGETSLMQFRNTERNMSEDDDESRTILVRGGKRQ